MSTTPATAQSPSFNITPNYRGADIRQVIEAVSEITGYTIIVDPRVQGSVTMYSSTPMSPQAFYQAFLSILQVHGYIAVESGNVVRITPDANARVVSGGAEGTGDEIVTRVLPLLHVPADQLVNSLRPLVPPNGHLSSVSGANALIVTDRALNVERIAGIVESVDRSGLSAGVEVIPLQHARASSIVEMLARTISPDAAGRPPVLEAYTPNNSLLFNGSPNQLAQLRVLLTQLDGPSSGAGGSRVHYLSYADAEDLAERLQQHYASSEEGDAIAIWADRQTNSLVITAPQHEMNAIMSVVERLDIRRAQILVEAIIVEVSSDRSAELGVTWAVDASGNGVAGLTNFPGIGPGLLQLAAPLIGGQTPNLNAFPEGIGLGIGRIVENGTSFLGLLQALQADNRVNVISTPIQLTLDNEEAEIKVGQQVPFLTGSYTNGDGTGAPGNPFQTIQREDVGTLLKLTPQINRDGTVTMRIELEISNIASTPAGAVDLVTSIREINTAVIVEDGGIIVLGGLIDEVVRHHEQRVPILGSLPIIGGLFRAQNTIVEKTNLMIFLRPTILLDGESVTQYTQEKYNLMRDLQLDLSGSPVPLLRDEVQPVLPPLDLRLNPSAP